MQNLKRHGGIERAERKQMYYCPEKVSGNIVDVVKRVIYPGTLEVAGGKIVKIVQRAEPFPTLLIPGFVDAHIHIESSMLVPSEFARAAAMHGTVACVCDPHEIANVMGMDGVKYMIKDGGSVPLKFYWGAPSCVPATSYETSGASIDVRRVAELLSMDGVICLSEMMNFPGVLNQDPEVVAKIDVARSCGKPIDGHAPGLRGSELMRYINCGISTDHECFLANEAREKILGGMRVQIREGSAAQNFDNLMPVAREYSRYCMFCSDDKHPDDLKAGHINLLVKRALECGINSFDALRMASVNPVEHYRLNVGLLQAGDPADFLEVDDFSRFRILKTFIDGRMVAQNGETLIPESEKKIINNFSVNEKSKRDFVVKNRGRRVRVIGAIDGQLLTRCLEAEPKVIADTVASDPGRDMLKIAVVNRYRDEPPSVGFVQGFGLREGAIASSVAHDSHNIIAVGVEDNDISRAVNVIIRNRGGISAVSSNAERILPLPVGGIISDLNYEEASRKYAELNEFARELGSGLKAPFMTLSFMALLVIPEIKLGDKGLFDVAKSEFVDLFVS